MKSIMLTYFFITTVYLLIFYLQHITDKPETRLLPMPTYIKNIRDQTRQNHLDSYLPPGNISPLAPILAYYRQSLSGDPQAILDKNSSPSVRNSLFQFFLTW